MYGETGYVKKGIKNKLPQDFKQCAPDNEASCLLYLVALSPIISVIDLFAGWESFEERHEMMVVLRMSFHAEDKSILEFGPVCVDISGHESCQRLVRTNEATEFNIRFLPKKLPISMPISVEMSNWQTKYATTGEATEIRLKDQLDWNFTCDNVGTCLILDDNKPITSSDIYIESVTHHDENKIAAYKQRLADEEREKQKAYNKMIAEQQRQKLEAKKQEKEQDKVCGSSLLIIQSSQKLGWAVLGVEGIRAARKAAEDWQRYDCNIWLNREVYK